MNRVDVEPGPSLALQFRASLFTYVMPSVVIAEVHKSSSRPFFSNGFRKFLQLTSVIRSGDGVALLEQFLVQHSF